MSFYLSTMSIKKFTMLFILISPHSPAAASFLQPQESEELTWECDKQQWKALKYQ